VNITADTNVLLRAIMGDDPGQSARAQTALASVTTIAVPLPVLCELVWVLSRGYRVPRPEIGRIITQLLTTAGVVTMRGAAEAGVAMLLDGGDFADGVIAHQGAWLGGEAFVSFDHHAVALLSARGIAARNP
jgi:predicted nucleic-acid-binding protein